MNPINMQTLSRPDSTDYPLQGDEVDWFTGFTPLGTQFLVVYQFPKVIVISFTSDGHMSGLTSPPGLPIDEALGFFSMEDDNILHSWLGQFGFQSGLIKVKRFMLPKHFIGIVDVPSSYSDILLNASQHSPEELILTHREVEGWSNEGLFVLWLNMYTDIWIDKTGVIVAT